MEVRVTNVDTVGLGTLSTVSISVWCWPRQVKNITARIVLDSGFEIVSQPQEKYAETDTGAVFFKGVIRATARGIWRVKVVAEGDRPDSIRFTNDSDFYIQVSDTLCRAMTDAEYILLQSPIGKTTRIQNRDKVIYRGQPGPMAQPAGPQPSESGYGGFRYIPKEPPATWEVSVLKTPQKIGDELQVQISLKFDEMPDCGVWDSVWQATILITRPDNSPRKYSSELTPIVVGKTEVFSIGEDATFEGTYQIAAEIVACTPKSDWDPSTDRGNTFAFMSKIVQNSVRIPITSQPDTGWHQLKNSTVMIKKLDGLGPPPEMQTKKMKLEVSKEIPPETAIGGKEEEAVRKYRFVVSNLNQQTSRRILLGDIKAKTNQQHEIEIGGVPKIDSARVVNSNFGRVSIRDSSTLLLRRSSAKGTGDIFIHVGKDTLVIRLISSLQVYNIYSQWYFQNETGGLLPAALIYAAVWYQDGLGYWHILTEGYSSVTGFLSLWSDEAECVLCFYAESDNASVLYAEDHSFDVGDNLYPYGVALSITNLGYQTVDIDTTWTCIRQPAKVGAFNIARAMVAAKSDLVSKVNPYPLPTPTPILWDSACSQAITPNYGGFIVGGSKAIFLRGDADPYADRDQWDYPVIFHEYSHMIMNTYASLDPNGGGDHEYWYPAHMGADAWKSKILAYQEGWAWFFQGVLRSMPDFFDRNNIGHNVWSGDMERPSPDIPYVLSMSQGAASNSTPFYNGADVEGSVAEALWDLYDKVDDDNYLYGGQIWGHNNDHNTSDSWSGIDAIWDVFWDYDPWPDSAGQQYCNNISQFTAGWARKGYPAGETFRNIFLAHAIRTCTCGDANGSGNINIADAVFLIAYIFAGGTPPGDCNYPNGMGDASGDGKINISDAVYLIAYIFVGGATPHCQGM